MQCLWKIGRIFQSILKWEARIDEKIATDFDLHKTTLSSSNHDTLDLILVFTSLNQ